MNKQREIIYDQRREVLDGKRYSRKHSKYDYNNSRRNSINIY